MSTVSEWFIHSVVCLTTRSQPLPKLLLHRVRSSTLSFNFQYLLSSLRSLSSCLRLLPRLHFYSSFFLSFNKVLQKQFLLKILPMHLAFCLFFYVGCNLATGFFVIRLHFSQERSKLPSPSFSSSTFGKLPGIFVDFPKCSSFSTVNNAPNATLHSFVSYI